MAYIRVDHSKFEAAASAAESHVELLRRKMSNAEMEVGILASNWMGQDANQFTDQWSKLTDSDSTYNNMVKALNSYADYLRFASKTYKDAQIAAVNRANWLPR